MMDQSGTVVTRVFNPCERAGMSGSVAFLRFHPPCTG
jgi:hypothetical protein